MQTEIIIRCAFGDEAAQTLLPYRRNGKTESMTLGHMILKLLLYSFERTTRYEIAFFPFLLLFKYRQADKDWLHNIKTVRDYAKSLIDKRIQSGEKKNDLLGILIDDEIFKGKE